MLVSMATPYEVLSCRQDTCKQIQQQVTAQSLVNCPAYSDHSSVTRVGKNIYKKIMVGCHLLPYILYVVTYYCPFTSEVEQWLVAACLFQRSSMHQLHPLHHYCEPHLFCRYNKPQGKHVSTNAPSYQNRSNKT